MKCFVIMPFAKAFDPVFTVVKDVATSAVPDNTFECFWLKDVHAAGRITEDIQNGLNEAAFCIADVSGHNPNVMWETGYAMALGKPTILIGQDIAGLPFDLKSHRVLEYAPGDPARFRQELGEAIRQTLARYSLARSGAVGLPSVRPAGWKTIAVTGTMAADEAVVTQRLESALPPYLSDSALWLAGSVGTVDLTAVGFLLERKQKVVVVGYHRFDCAPELRKLVEAGTLGFVDASVEPIRKSMAGPNQRDAFFCTKADLVILLWDGLSSGTRSMIEYFQGERVATLLVTL